MVRHPDATEFEIGSILVRKNVGPDPDNGIVITIDAGGRGASVTMSPKEGHKLAMELLSLLENNRTFEMGQG